MKQPLIQRLSIIGTGLIGGSLALALRKAGQVGEIIGCGRNLDNLEQAQALGIIDRYNQDYQVAVDGASVVVVAVPLGNMAQVFAQLRGVLSTDTIITDVGSAKATVIADAREHLGEHLSRFVPGHPIAGTEKSGASAAFATLFNNRRVILSPIPETDIAACHMIEQMWMMTGAEIINMSVAHHDEILAATSHLPHVVAYSLVDTLASMENQQEIFQFAGGGFRDFTRIASSDPTMWHDISLANREALLRTIDLFMTNLKGLRQAIAEGNSQYIIDTYTHAKIARDDFVRQFDAKKTS